MDIDDVVDNISLDVKARVVNTVGYSEAENKASYLSGVNTACVFMGEYAKDFLKVIIQVKDTCGDLRKVQQ